jgi:hypothetical protein
MLRTAPENHGPFLSQMREVRERSYRQQSVESLGWGTWRPRLDGHDDGALSTSFRSLSSQPAGPPQPSLGGGGGGSSGGGGGGAAPVVNVSLGGGVRATTSTAGRSGPAAAGVGGGGGSGIAPVVSAALQLHRALPFTRSFSGSRLSLGSSSVISDHSGDGDRLSVNADAWSGVGAWSASEGAPTPFESDSVFDQGLMTMNMRSHAMPGGACRRLRSAVRVSRFCAP